ncbi:NADPH-dependent FMN reductase [Pseudonocardia sp. KRD291]|uniref:NADPH-dependent FMN reductase n=1 Tax=Pseudonocardia sp. KRD291 TaxID=2792007 RepID=UPI001C4A4094|nr:NAD(P)H-dependent oxidoreductase [Pseudonocardia sp. KRD291]MBW0103107.1 NAD(P)H-dependent oxidoreductase [Pseudonocardia sp. KRD291]
MSDTDRPILQVIVGSTRPGRAGLPVGRWICGRAREHGGFDVELVDLAEVGLPLFDEPHHPRLKRYTHEHTRRWSATVDRADAFVFVVPEYNHSINAATKNAIDHLNSEWAHKPAGLVSYGGVAGGTRAVTALEPVLNALRMTPLPGVIVPFVAQFVHGEGDERTFEPNDEIAAGAKAMLDELARVAPALRSLRAG